MEIKEILFILSIALFGDVAIKFLTKRNEDAKPTVINLKA